jgi:hypothetical protein
MVNQRDAAPEREMKRAVNQLKGGRAQVFGAGIKEPCCRTRED